MQRIHFKEKILEDLELILNGVRNPGILIHVSTTKEDINITITIVDPAVIEDPQDPEVLTADTEIEEVVTVGVDQVQVPAVVVIDALTTEIEKDHLVQEVIKI